MKDGFRAEFETGYLQRAVILHQAKVTNGTDVSIHDSSVKGYSVGRLVKVTKNTDGTYVITKPTTGVGTITASTNLSTFNTAVAAGAGDATHIIAQSDNSVRNTIDDYIHTDKYDTRYDGIVKNNSDYKAIAVYPIVNKDDVKLVQIGVTPTA